MEQSTITSGVGMITFELFVFSMAIGVYLLYRIGRNPKKQNRGVPKSQDVPPPPIRRGDWVFPKKEYSNLIDSFDNRPRQVIRIEKNNLPYTGGIFVHCRIGEKEVVFYGVALKVVESNR